MRHIRHWQSQRSSAEAARLEQQAPERVSQRVKERMPTQQQLRKIRSDELVRSGLSPRLASSALASALGQEPGGGC